MQPQTEEIDTSDWLTYRDEELGISFRYPRDLTTDRTGLSILLWDDSYNSITRSCSVKCEPKASIHIDSLAIDSSLADYILNSTNDQIKDTELLQLANGSEAYYVMDGGGYRNPQMLFVEEANQVAIITSLPSQISYPILKKIGESVELTATREISNADWPRHSNPVMGISFSYPSNWSLVPSSQYSLSLIKPDQRLQHDRWGVAAMGVRVSTKETDNIETINDLRAYLEQTYEWDIQNMGLKIQTLTSDSGTQIYWLNGVSGEIASDDYYAKIGDGFVTFGNWSTQDPDQAATYHRIVSSVSVF